MWIYSREAFENFLIERGLIEFWETPIPLAHGGASHWYAGLRDLSGRKGPLKQAADYVLSFVYQNIGTDFDYIVGVPSGATDIAAKATELHHGENYEGRIIRIRELEKRHGIGRDRHFRGPVETEDKAVLLEDVATTGKTMLQAAEKLKRTGVEIIAYVAMLNRQERFSPTDGRNIADILNENKKLFYAMTTAETLLPKAVKRLHPPVEIVRELNAYFEKYGTVKIELASA